MIKNLWKRIFRVKEKWASHIRFECVIDGRRNNAVLKNVYYPVDNLESWIQNEMLAQRGLELTEIKILAISTYPY